MDNVVHKLTQHNRLYIFSFPFIASLPLSLCHDIIKESVLRRLENIVTEPLSLDNQKRSKRKNHEQRDANDRSSLSF